MDFRLPFCLLLAATLAGFTALPGCHWRPLDGADSIYRNDNPGPDPAVRSPNLNPSGPGKVDSPDQAPGPGRSMLVVVPTQPDFPSIDKPAANPAALPVQAWVDNHQPADAIGEHTVRIRQPVSRQPTLRFELDRRLGQFRGATILIFRVVRDQPDPATGLRLSEGPDYSVLLPGRPIDLARLAPPLVCRRTATNEPVKTIELAPAADYEIQFLVSGSRQDGLVVVRVRTAAPETVAATRPDNAAPRANPDEPDPTHLPPGVTVPK